MNSLRDISIASKAFEVLISKPPTAENVADRVETLMKAAADGIPQGKLASILVAMAVAIGEPAIVPICKALQGASFRLAFEALRKIAQATRSVEVIWQHAELPNGAPPTELAAIFDDSLLQIAIDVPAQPSDWRLFALTQVTEAAKPEALNPACSELLDRRPMFRSAVLGGLCARTSVPEAVVRAAQRLLLAPSTTTAEMSMAATVVMRFLSPDEDLGAVAVYALGNARLADVCLHWLRTGRLSTTFLEYLVATVESVAMPRILDLLEERGCSEKAATTLLNRVNELQDPVSVRQVSRILWNAYAAGARPYAVRAFVALDPVFVDQAIRSLSSTTALSVREIVELVDTVGSRAFLLGVRALAAVPSPDATAILADMLRPLMSARAETKLRDALRIIDESPQHAPLAAAIESDLGALGGRTRVWVATFLVSAGKGGPAAQVTSAPQPQLTYLADLDIGRPRPPGADDSDTARRLPAQVKRRPRYRVATKLALLAWAATKFAFLAILAAGEALIWSRFHVLLSALRKWHRAWRLLTAISFGTALCYLLAVGWSHRAEWHPSTLAWGGVLSLELCSAARWIQDDLFERHRHKILGEEAPYWVTVGHGLVCGVVWLVACIVPSVSLSWFWGFLWTGATSLVCVLVFWEEDARTRAELRFEALRVDDARRHGQR